MKLDIFHSLSRIDSVSPTLTDYQVFQNFITQVKQAEDLGYETIWVAESHFSSEVQKKHPYAVIPNFSGEVGLNCDSFQLANWIFSQTKSINFGTAILNIVGGNGGPIAAADRVRSLEVMNELQSNPRQLHIGVAAGRFPYINKPFGILPRNEVEEFLWPAYQRLIFIEALEIFLRLSHGESISSADTAEFNISEDLYKHPDDLEQAKVNLIASLGQDDQKLSQAFKYKKRWHFDELKLVPELPKSRRTNFILGSSDPIARKHGLKFDNLDIFNLSFTPPEKLNLLHAEMQEHYNNLGHTWQRHKLPRTVLIFINEDSQRAHKEASECFDTYINAMQGTAQVPPKQVLIDRALIGSPAEIIDGIALGSEKGFHPEDRLMLWFEFNQPHSETIMKSMELFASTVKPHIS